LEQLDTVLFVGAGGAGDLAWQSRAVSPIMTLEGQILIIFG
jgi:hypothetical protein